MDEVGCTNYGCIRPVVNKITITVNGERMYAYHCDEHYDRAVKIARVITVFLEDLEREEDERLQDRAW